MQKYRTIDVVVPEIQEAQRELERMRSERRAFIARRGRLPGWRGRLAILRGEYPYVDGSVRSKRWWSRRSRKIARTTARVIDATADDIRRETQRRMSNLLIFGHEDGLR
jgi:hypothetical protein